MLLATGTGHPPWSVCAARGREVLSLTGGASSVPEVGAQEAKTALQVGKEGGRPEGMGEEVSAQEAETALQVGEEKGRPEGTGAAEHTHDVHMPTTGTFTI